MGVLIILVLCVCADSMADGYFKESCSGTQLNNIICYEYETEILKTNLIRPFHLTVNLQTNTLYFSYQYFNKTSNNLKHRSAKLNLNNLAFKDIEGIEGGFTQVADNKNNVVYIGGDDGIYIYHENYKNELPEYYTAKGFSVHTLTFKDILYFLDYPDNKIYTVVDGKVEKFTDLEDTTARQFLIDNTNTMFYMNSTGFYSQNMGTRTSQATFLTGKQYIITCVITDYRGKIYVCLHKHSPYQNITSGLYKIDKDIPGMKLVVKIGKPWGAAFDVHNYLIYSDDSRIVRLKTNRFLNRARPNWVKLSQEAFVEIPQENATVF